MKITRIPTVKRTIKNLVRSTGGKRVLKSNSQFKKFPKDFGSNSDRFGSETPPEWMLKKWSAA